MLSVQLNIIHIIFIPIVGSCGPRNRDTGPKRPKEYNETKSELKTVPPDIPADTTHIWISNTSIQRITSNVFINYTKLYQLKLNGNQIDTIEQLSLIHI